MTQTDEENPKWWFFSGSFDSLTTAFQSIASVTSSTRSFFTGCFRCNHGSNGCFKKGDTPPDGAWFDCEQLQIEHPYCYVNPVALDHFDCSATPKNDNKSIKSKESNGISPKKLTAVSSQPICDETKKELRQNSSSKRSNVSDLTKEGMKSPKCLKYKTGLIDASSFVSKLERDHFGYRKDILRAEGEVTASRLTRSGSERSVHRPSIRSPVLQRSNLQYNKGFDLEDRNWDEESFASLEDDEDGEGGEEEDNCQQSGLFGDVWRPNELENAFHVYNMSSVQSLGYLHSVTAQQKLSRKNSPEKFEDYFPTQLNKYNNNNNNNTINSEKNIISSINDSNLLCDKEKLKEKEEVSQRIKHENVLVKENIHKSELTEEELNEFINICIFVDNFHELDKLVSNNKEYHCDNLFTYCGKSFKSKLIFDLVKEIKNDCIVQYSNSIVLCDEYPVNIVQTKVINALKFNEKYQYSQIPMLENIERLRQRMFILNDVNEIGKVPEEILIENLTAEEIRREGKLWQIVDSEENAIKNKICDEIFNDFLNKELSVLTNIIKSKEINFNKHFNEINK